MYVLIPPPPASWEAFRSLDVVLGQPLIVKLFLVRQGWLIALKVKELKEQHEVTAVMRCH